MWCPAALDRLLLGVGLALCAAACGCQRDPNGETSPAISAALPSGASSSAEIAHFDVLPDRAEVVARADTLAVQAGKQPDTRAGDLMVSAATLRERLWRRDHKRVDALEAIEVFTSASALAWPGACVAGLSAALLRGELNGDPEQTYRDVYVASRRQPTKDCRDRAESALAALAAYRPNEDELKRLAADTHGSPKTEGSTSPAEAPRKEDSQVVVPDLLEQTLRTPSKITKVEPYGASDSARVVVHLSHPTRFEVGTAEATAGQEPRLYVDVSGASYEGKASFEVGGLVHRVRLGKRDNGMRLVLDLEQAAYHRVFYLPEPFRLVIDVSKSAPAVAKARRAISRVVLDPGHGGNDPGAQGPNGLREKDVTLDVAHRAAPLLAREVGVSTLLTRDVDAYVPLDERAARANAFNADLFISVHCNASESTDQHGVMTFVLDTSKDSLAGAIAARENHSSEAAAAELANSLSRVNDAGRLQASEQFAELLQRAASASLGRRYGDVRDHGVRRAGFYVLAGAHMPAVLFESSFISNQEEARRLNSGDYRQRLADALVNAVRAYRDGR